MTSHIPTFLSLIAFTAVTSATLAPAPALAQFCPPRGSLTGTWIGNDQGRYYLHQIGNTVWWVGLDATTNGSGWTHAFRGFRNGDTVSGSWADVRGPMGNGTMVLRQRNGNYLTRMSAAGSGFGGTRWHRAGCPAV